MMFHYWLNIVGSCSKECFHMTPRRPCWCPKPVLWELNSFLTQTLSFVPINLHSRWPREWIRSTERLFSRGQQLCKSMGTKECVFYKRNRHYRRGTLIKATCKRTRQLPTLLRQQCCVLLRPCCSSVQTHPTVLGVVGQQWLNPVQKDATLLANNSQHCWMLHVAFVWTLGCMLLRVVGSCCAKFETRQTQF